MGVYGNESLLATLGANNAGRAAENISRSNEEPLLEEHGSQELSIAESLEGHLSHHENVTAEENHMMEKMWFKMSREDGGPSLFTEMAFAYPKFFYSRDLVIVCFVFAIPLVVFLVLLPTFRKKHWPSVFVVVMCYLCGLGIFCSYVSSSWLTGQTTVEMPLGPKSPPTKGTVSVMVGLWHANLTLTTSKSHYNYMVAWSNREEMLGIHKSSLEKGWPYPLVSLTAELSGETEVWHGVLGEGMVHAGAMASYLLVAAMYTWVTWIVILLEAPELTSQPLIVTGILMAFSALAYIGWGAYYIPSKFILGGHYMMLKFGWAWWVTAIMSILLTIAGILIFIYDHVYPGKLGAMFKVDFYSHSARVVQAAELLHTYENANESYSSMYPLSLSYMWHGNKNDKAQSLINKNSKESASNNTDTLSTNGEIPADNETVSEKRNMTLQYMNEMGIEEPEEEGPINTSIITDASSIIFTKTASPTCQAESTSIRKRSPPEKVLNKTSISEPVLTISHRYATIKKGRSIPRHVSVPIIVPQVSPRGSAGRHKKSLSRIHSKYRPSYSPRKPSISSLVSLPKLELEDTDENVTYL